VQSQTKLSGAPYFWKEADDLTACEASAAAGAWQGIGCNAVTNMSLPGLNLGPVALPASFANLTQLQEINLENNSFNGTIPNTSNQLSCKYDLLGLHLALCTRGLDEMGAVMFSLSMCIARSIVNAFSPRFFTSSEWARHYRKKNKDVSSGT
jgi:hypothetical protein